MLIVEGERGILTRTQCNASYLPSLRLRFLKNSSYFCCCCCGGGGSDYFTIVSRLYSVTLVPSESVALVGTNR